MAKRALLLLACAAAVVRRVIGAPDYDHYLEHMRDHHPDLTPLSRERFMSAHLHARFDKPGARCC